jgi:hypothetical protein
MPSARIFGVLLENRNLLIPWSQVRVLAGPPSLIGIHGVMAYEPGDCIESNSKARPTEGRCDSGVCEGAASSDTPSFESWRPHHSPRIDGVCGHMRV